jgi:hypothetical protein
MKRLRVLTTSLGLGLAATVALAPAVEARPTSPGQGLGHHAAARSALGATTVMTAPGIAATLSKAGILPLPVARTGLGISLRNGLQVSYRFPITANTADLATGSGNIRHAGGIWFAGRHARLEVGRFDIDVAAGTVFATEVNFAPGRVALLDLDLSALKVTAGPDGSTVLTGITVRLAAEAADALNATFGLALPTDGSLAFGTAQVRLR